MTHFDLDTGMSLIIKDLVPGVTQLGGGDIF